MFIKIQGEDGSQTLAQLQNTWKQRVAHRPFEYHYLDEDYATLYKTEQRTAAVFTSFSALAIILACLGLFALTAYSMVQRTKEIGIRKILGASLLHILGLMSRDIVRLLVLALVIAIPLAWMAMQQWLEKFTYKVSLQWWVFALSGLLALLVSFCTIFLQVLRTSQANPVKSLRTE